MFKRNYIPENMTTVFDSGDIADCISVCSDAHRLHDFQENTFAKLKDRHKKFVQPKALYEREALHESGGFHLAAWDTDGELFASLMCHVIYDTESYNSKIALDLHAGRDCYTAAGGLVLTTALVDPDFHHMNVMDALFQLAQQHAVEMRLPSIGFVSAVDNLPLLRSAFDKSFYAVGMGRHRTLNNQMYLCEWQSNKQIKFSDDCIAMPLQDRGDHRLETYFDADYALTGIDISKRELLLRQHSFIDASQQTAA